MSFRTRLVIAFTVLASGFTIGATLYFFQVAERLVYEQMSLRLKDIGRLGQYMLTAEDRDAIQRLDLMAAEASGTIDQDRLSAIEEGDTDQPLSSDDITALQSRPDFQRLVQVMRAIKRATRDQVVLPQVLPQTYLDMEDLPQVRFVYILTAIPESPDRTILRFIVDGDYEEIDLDQDGQIGEDEQATQLGLLYNVTGQDRLRAAFDGNVYANEEFATDTWGTWFSSYIPIYNADGTEVIAVMGVDLDAHGPYNSLEAVKRVAIGICVVTVLLCILAAWLLARWLTGPIAELTRGADRVRQRDFSVQIDVRSKDEIGHLAQAFNVMVAEIGSYSEGLEAMVAQRTNELSTALDDVKSLKNQQDADYFLTTLLTNPLFRNFSKSRAVHTEFLIEQKKRFQFKKFEAHLGGDLCVSGNLRFPSGRWTMFVNGDAMGKSMQGAGGALIMGAVVNSIMHRSAADDRILTMSPEEWLRETYRELNDVFRTFDGSMFVSCVLGIVEDATGRLLYFNSEHPSPVLYRNGTAVLLDEGSHLPKLGMPFPTDFEMQSYQLEPGDVLLVGSDGKDDLVLSVSDEGRVINEDPEVFLKLVERGKGDLKAIHEEALKTGDLTDDLSMIRVEYAGAAAQKSGPDRVDIDAVTELIRAHDFGSALALLEERPAESLGFAAIYYRGLCLARLGRDREAAETLQHAQSFDREHAAVYRLLAKVYRNLGNENEAREYESRAAELDRSVKN
ncbi:MAG: SpoIIE family protein phosphatase [Spirochaetales bacterium]|nr:SpoIIE family protein phosphatase [Leptospiraceae bacterium]MCP5481880.1 SpoIIE family protein phosphatase [Spirochaetales bacterium]MCP5486313.1 SpoIIE family protein phosphatase [Spirochaetales bacterium]